MYSQPENLGFSISNIALAAMAGQQPGWMILRSQIWLLGWALSVGTAQRKTWIQLRCNGADGSHCCCPAQHDWGLTP